MKNIILALLSSCFLQSAFALEINVSTSGSDASGDGTKEKPFASMSAAIAKLKQHRKVNPNEEVDLVLSEGIYFFKNDSDCAKLSSADLPNSNKKIRIVGRGKVTFVGGVRLKTSDLTRVEDKDFLSRLPKSREGVLYFVDLKKFGVRECGAWHEFGFSSGNGGLAPTEIFSPNFKMVCARYPNAETMNWAKTLVEANFSKQKWDGKTFGKFVYADPRHERWVNSSDVMLSGVFNPEWAYDVVRVGKIDAKEKTVELKSRLAYGLRSETKKRFLRFNKYFAFNIPEEMDMIGEYWIDVKNSLAYMLLPKRVPQDAHFDVSVCGAPFISLDDMGFVEIRGIDFRATRATAVSFKNSHDCRVMDCNFMDIGCRGVSFSTKTFLAKDADKAKMFSYNNRIENCAAINTGLGGFSMMAGERVNLKRGNSVIKNCILRDNARLGYCYSAGVSISGCGITVQHCDIRNQPHLGIAWGGNDLTISSNYFSRCCEVFDDMGAIYTGRNMSHCGNVVRGNFFAEITPKNPDAMMCGVYVDDGSGHFTIDQNIFCRVGNPGDTSRFGTVFFHGGDNNVVSRNIFIDCIAAVAHSPWNDKFWEKKMLEYADRLKKWVDIDSAEYQKRYPFLKDIRRGDRPRYNKVWGNLFYNTNMTRRGVYEMSGNLPISPDNGAKSVDVKYWDIASFVKYFGKNPQAKKILDMKPGLLTPLNVELK